jgi:hypothetical protein
MPKSSSRRATPVCDKTELETVVCWPLIYAVSGFVLLASVAIIGLVTASVLNRPTRDPAAPRWMESPTPARPPARAVARAPRRSQPVDDSAHEEDATPEPARPARELLPAPKVDAVPKLNLAAVRPLPATIRKDRMRVVDRPRHWTESEILALLRKLPEIDLGVDEAKKLRTLVPAKEAGKSGNVVLTHPGLKLLKGRSDLRGLPFLTEGECLATQEHARMLARASRDIPRLESGRGARRTSGGVRSEDFHEKIHEEARFARALASLNFLRVEAGVGPVMQILQAEGVVERRQLIEYLAHVNGTASTKALAHRAVFDVTPEMRLAAVIALQTPTSPSAQSFAAGAAGPRPAAPKDLPKRTREEARSVLLAALRYPWAPAADNAAHALVALKDRAAVASLRALLDKPDPTLPYLDASKNFVLTEPVRVNHLRNCLLCHPPSNDGRDPVRGPVPEPGKPLPERYYASSRGTLVRADITYLRQDFSARLKVEKADPWPDEQRYDFVLRTRKLTDGERASLAVKASAAGKKAGGELRSSGGVYRRRLLFVIEELEELPPE